MLHLSKSLIWTRAHNLLRFIRHVILLICVVRSFRLRIVSVITGKDAKPASLPSLNKRVRNARKRGLEGPPSQHVLDGLAPLHILVRSTSENHVIFKMEPCLLCWEHSLNTASCLNLAHSVHTTSFRMAHEPCACCDNRGWHPLNGA